MIECKNITYNKKVMILWAYEITCNILHTRMDYEHVIVTSGGYTCPKNNLPTTD